MKKLFQPKIIALLMLAVVFSRCGMRNVSMNAMRSAEITFPSYVNTLLLVDRTKFDKNAVNIIEGILTGELPGQDRAGLQEAMSSLHRNLMASPRFQVKVATESLKGNSITLALPEPLSWTQIERLCDQYGTEAVVAIEVFDSDFIVTDGKRRVKKQVDDGTGKKKEIEVDEFYAEGVANVTIGFRLYDPKARSIVDQQVFSHTNTWQATGKSASDAVAHLIVKNEATKFVSNVAGNAYANKIAPMPIRISRQFYSRSRHSPEINEGARQADVGDWKGAIKTWEGGINTSRAKEAGRLCYNIAVAYEVLGELETAKKWTQRAFVEYGNKKARDYSNVIWRRMQEEERVKEQMK